MREIKFRVWDKSNKQMIDLVGFAFPDLVRDESGERDFLGFMGGFGGTIKGKESQFDLLQYVGLKDKNGKEIFEGDVVKKTFGSFSIDFEVGIRSGDKEGIFSIGYNNLHCCYGLFKGLGFVDGIMASEYDKKGARHTGWQSTDIEVIGNIYENPELNDKQS